MGDEKSINLMATAIYKDVLKAAKCEGFTSDLDIPFIEKAIEEGCVYCGVKPEESRLTLIVIDESRCHTKDNSVCACTICSGMRSRGQILHEGMLIVGKAVKDTRLKGLFGEWTGEEETGRKAKIIKFEGAE